MDIRNVLQHVTPHRSRRAAENPARPPRALYVSMCLC